LVGRFVGVVLFAPGAEKDAKVDGGLHQEEGGFLHSQCMSKGGERDGAEMAGVKPGTHETWNVHMNWQWLTVDPWTCSRKKAPLRLLPRKCQSCGQRELGDHGNINVEPT
jgi:hypothetical protein